MFIELLASDLFFTLVQSDSENPTLINVHHYAIITKADTEIFVLYTKVNQVCACQIPVSKMWKTC